LTRLIAWCSYLSARVSISYNSVTCFLETGDDAVDESSAQEVFEEKLNDAIEGLLEKR